jgi:hypothetical protein
MLENQANAISNEAKVDTAKKDKALQGVCLTLVVFKEGAICSTNFHSSVEPTADQEVQVWLHNYPEEYERKEEDGTKKTSNSKKMLHSSFFMSFLKKQRLFKAGRQQL